ncbi:hypothetical protein AAZX31_03G084100, partial [Glycine max]
TKKQFLFSLLFSTMRKNQIITIFLPFSTSSSKCRKTPRSCRVFLPIGALPSPPPCGWSTGFITTPPTGRLPSQHLDPALPIFFWFTPNKKSKNTYTDHGINHA